MIVKKLCNRIVMVFNQYMYHPGKPLDIACSRAISRLLDSEFLRDFYPDLAFGYPESG